MRILSFILILLWGANAWSSTPLSAVKTDINLITENDDLGRWVSYIEDESGELELSALLQTNMEEWNDHEGTLVNFGYSASAFWFKLTLINDSPLSQERLLEIGYCVLDNLDIYVVRTLGDIERVSLGDKHHFNTRAVQNRNFLVPINFEEGEQLSLYLRVKTNSSVQLPLSLWEPNKFNEDDQLKLISHGVYFGIALVMIIYNLFVFIAVSERVYLYYVVCISFMALFLASLNGLTFQYLWPSATWWNDQSIVFFLNGGVLFGSLFSLSFLSIHPVSERLLNRFMSFLVAASGVLMILSVVLPYQLIIRPTILLSMVVCMTLILSGAYRWYRGDVYARYFTIAWFSLLLGGLILALNKITILPQNIFTENATQIGSAIEIVLLSLALADRLYQEKSASISAQQQALVQERAARLAQEKTLSVQREANILLEKRVQERTAELELLNDRLIELSCTDALTGVKNRGGFEEAFKIAFVAAIRYSRPISLLVIDIDHFKLVNDKYGHQAGDECLRRVSSVLLQVISRPQDLVARYGGEEFVVLLPDTADEGAYKVAEKIRQDIESTKIEFNGQVIRLTVSIGVDSMVPKTQKRREDMFGAADKALYKAKRSGRNKVVVV